MGAGREHVRALKGASSWARAVRDGAHHGYKRHVRLQARAGRKRRLAGGVGVEAVVCSDAAGVSLGEGVDVPHRGDRSSLDRRVDTEGEEAVAVRCASRRAIVPKIASAGAAVQVVRDLSRARRVEDAHARPRRAIVAGLDLVARGVPILRRGM